MCCFKEEKTNILQDNIAFVHEVKNPLSLIKAHIEYLELDKNLSIYKANINTIKKEINKISEIVSNCLNDYKKNRILEKINLIEIAKENVKNFDIYENINFQINIEQDKNKYEIISNKNELNMLFSNLIKNSIESINKKSGKININFYLKNKNIVIEIVDNGDGLKIDNINQTTTKKYGHGIGLEVCKKIAQNINSQFELLNNKTNGCTAKITIHP